jgi:glyoxylase-like metal-dependent hydrolase (beta-lactamase superfamily II)
MTTSWKALMCAAAIALVGQPVRGTAASAPAPRTGIRFDAVVPGFLPMVVDDDGFPKGTGFAGVNRWGQYTAYLLATNARGQRTWRIEDVLPNPASDMAQASTMYLLEGRDRALLIDTGLPARYREGVDDLKTVVRYLLAHENDGRVRLKPLDFVVANTHNHPDHIGENRLMQDRTVYYMDGDWPAVAPPNYMPIREGGGPTAHGSGKAVASIDLGGGRVLEAIAMPPHTAGSTGYLDRPNGLLFSGDAVGSAWPFLQASSLAVYDRTIHHLERLTRDMPSIMLLPAHFYQIAAWGRADPPLNGRPLDRNYILDQIALADGILAGDIDGEPFFSNQSTYWATHGTAKLVYALDRIAPDEGLPVSYHAARLKGSFRRAWASGLPVSSQDVLRSSDLGASVFLIRQSGGPSLYLLRGSSAALLVGTGRGAPGLARIVDRLREGRPLDVALLDGSADQIGGLSQLEPRTIYGPPGGPGTVALADGQEIDLGKDDLGRPLEVEAQGFRVAGTTRLTLVAGEDGLLFSGDALGRRTGLPGFDGAEPVPFDISDPRAYAIGLSDWSSRTIGKYRALYSTGTADWFTNPQYVVELEQAVHMALSDPASPGGGAAADKVFHSSGPGAVRAAVRVPAWAIP